MAPAKRGRPKGSSGTRRSADQIFRETTSERMTRILKNGRLIEKQAKRGGWTEAQADAVVKALEDQTERLKKAFSAPVAEEKEFEFSL